MNPDACRIVITNELAQAVGRLAAKNLDCSVTIAWRGDLGYGEREWHVTLDAGYGTCTYVVDDETGESRLAGIGEHA